MNYKQHLFGPLFPEKPKKTRTDQSYTTNFLQRLKRSDSQTFKRSRCLKRNFYVFTISLCKVRKKRKIYLKAPWRQQNHRTLGTYINNNYTIVIEKVYNDDIEFKTE